MKSIKFVISMALALCLALGFALPGIAEDFRVRENAAPAGPGMLNDEILVKFKPGVIDIASTNAALGAVAIATSSYSGVVRLKIPPDRTVAEMVAIYGSNPNVAYAEPNFTARALGIPNDPFYAPYQWHFDNLEYGGINMEAAWDITTGDAGVIVAVIDTGVAYEDYQEFVPLGRRNGYWVTYQKAPDLTGTAFVPGYDFVNNDAHANDDEGHGTHVTGTIAQSTNNAMGVAGIAYGTSIMPVKVLDSSGSGSYAAIADGIYFAADNGARVISMSLGGGSGSLTLENALAYAHARGVTIVCASGNDGSTDTISYPAAYDAYCIAVGATRYDEAVTGYSNRGASLDLTAPGGDTGVDQNGDGYVDGVLQQTFGSSPTDFAYYFYQGTSMATPHVSGVAALLLAQDPTRSPAEIREILQSTAEDKGPPGWDPAYGWGIIDAAAALSYDAAPNHAPAAAISSPTSGTEDVAVAFDATSSHDEDGDTLTYRWDFGDGTTGAGATASHTYTAGGRYYTVSLVVNDGKADSAPATTTLWITEVNDPPVADAGSDQNVLVNQAVAFDASGSYDIDDGISSFFWNFGDGNTATGQTASHRYPTAGSYTVTLRVTDAGGLSDSDKAVIDVADEPVLGTLYADIGLSLSERQARRNIFVKAVAVVSITDGAGPVSGVSISGFWGDAPSSLVSAVTDSSGQAVFQSAEVKNPKSGTTFTLTVTETVKTGYSPSPQGETSDSISY